MTRFSFSQFGRDIILIIVLKIVAIIILYAIFFHNSPKPQVTPARVAEKIIHL